MELGANIVTCHPGFGLEVLRHQVKVVIIKVDHQHLQSFVSLHLLPLGFGLSEVLGAILAASN